MLEKPASAAGDHPEPVGEPAEAGGEAAGGRGAAVPDGAGDGLAGQSADRLVDFLEH